MSVIRFRPLNADRFPIVIPENGSRHAYRTLLETLGSGVAAVDIDLDECPDILISGGGDFRDRRAVPKPLSLLRNLDQCFVDVTGASGMPATRFYSHGLATIDVDHDGFPDALLTGYGGIQLFRNCGDGTFEDRTSASGLNISTWCSSAAWGDFNLDGEPDLFVPGYVDWSFDNDPPCYTPDGAVRDTCSPKLFQPLPDHLFLSHGDGTWSDETENSDYVRTARDLSSGS
ncbi:MAG: VCBS repeat-containing protein [Planctomycetaceae bacterium]